MGTPCLQVLHLILGCIHSKALLSLPAVLAVLAALARDLQVREREELVFSSLALRPEGNYDRCIETAVYLV
jgi:hypothetical protein